MNNININSYITITSYFNINRKYIKKKLIYIQLNIMFIDNNY